MPSPAVLFYMSAETHGAHHVFSLKAKVNLAGVPQHPQHNNDAACWSGYVDIAAFAISGNLIIFI